MAQAIEELLLKITTQVGGAVALSELMTQFIDLNKHAETLHRALTAVEGSSQKADDTFRYLVDSANKYGLGIEQVTNGYMKLAAAAKGTELEGEATRKIFESVSSAMSVLGAESVTTNRAFVALAQMMSKGQIYAEELRGQLAEALPDAIQVMATALGIGTDKLYELMKAGALGSDTLIPFAEELDKRYGSLAKGTATLAQESSRLKNAFYESAISIEKTSGLYTGITNVVGYLAKNGEELALVFSGVLAAALAKITQLTISSTQSVIAYSTALVEKNAVAKQTAATELQLAESSMLVARATLIEATNTQFAAKVGLNYAYVNLQNAQTSAERAIALEALKIAEGRHAATVIASIQAQRGMDAALKATTQAQLANAAANSIWSRAMSFLAGPGGLILAAAAGMAYFTSKSNEQKDVTQELAKGVEEYNDKLRAMNQEQLAAEVEKLNISYKNQSKEIDSLNEAKQRLIELTATSDNPELLDQIVLKNGEIADAKQRLIQITEALAVAEIESGKSQEEVFKKLSAEVRNRVKTTIELNDKMRESEWQTKLVSAANEAEAQSIKGIIDLQNALAKASNDAAQIREVEIANSNRKIELAKIELSTELQKQSEYKTQLELVRQKIVNEKANIDASEKLNSLTKDEIEGLKSKSVQTQKELLEKELLVAKSEKEVEARRNAIKILEVEAEAQRLSTSLLSVEFAKQEKIIADAGVSIAELTAEYNRLVAAGENAAILNGVLNQIKAKQDEAAKAAQAMGNALSSAFKAVGLDYEDVANGMDFDTKRMIDGFGQLGKFSIVAADDIQRAFTNVLAKANTEEELKLIETQLIKLGSQGKIGGDQLAQSLAAVNTKAVELRAEVNPLQLAMEKLGIGVPEKLAAVANESEKLYLTVKNSKAPIDEVQQAFLKYAEDALIAAENGAKIDLAQLKAEASARGLDLAFDALVNKTRKLSPEYEAAKVELERLIEIQTKEGEEALKSIDLTRNRIAISLELAKAKGDEKLIADEMLKQAEQNIIYANKEIEVTQNKIKAVNDEIARLEYLAGLEKPDAEKQAYIQLLRDQNAERARSVIILQDRNVQLEKEKEHARLMAGPVGQLTRLYAEQAKEHERTAASSERYQNSLVKEAENTLKLAQIKGNASEIDKAQSALNEQKIQQAQALANTRAIEARDSENAVSAKVLEMAADGEWTKADQEVENQMRATAAARRDAAIAAQENVSSMRDEIKATEEAAAAAKKLADEQKAAAEAAAQLKAAAAGVNSNMAAVTQAFEETGGNVEKLTAAFNEMRATTNNALSADPWIAWSAAIAANADKVVQSYNNQKSALDGNVATLQRFADEGGNVAEIQRIMIQGSGNLENSFSLLDEQDLDNLRSAMDSANDKLREMQNEAEDARLALAEMNAELLAEQGNTAAADKLKLQIEETEKLADIERRLAEARATGNTEAAKYYAAMIEKAKELYRVKNENLNAELAGNDKTSKANQAAITQAGELASALERSASAAKTLNRVPLDGLLNNLNQVGEAVNRLRSAL